MQAVILANSSSADAVILLHHSAVKTKNIGKQFTQRWRLAKYKSKRVMHRWWYVVFREPWLSFHSVQTHWWQQIFNAACKAAALLTVCEHGGRTSTQRDRTTPGLEATQQKKNWSTTQLSIWVKQSLEMNGGNKTPVHLRGTEQACFWRGLHLDPRYNYSSTGVISLLQGSMHLWDVAPGNSRAMSHLSPWDVSLTGYPNCPSCPQITFKRQQHST